MKFISSKDKLINATIEAIYTNGLHSVTTAKIAKTAKLSEAMIYKHFGNKNEMIIESFMFIKLGLNSFVESKITMKMDFKTKSYNIWLAHVDYFIDNYKHLRVLNQVEYSNYMTDEIREECLILSKSVITFFKTCIKQNIFKDIHLEIAVALFFSPILSISESIIEKRLDRSEKILNICYESTMDALRVKKNNFF